MYGYQQCVQGVGNSDFIGVDVDATSSKQQQQYSSSSVAVESRGQSEHKMKLIKLGIRVLRVYVFSSTVLCDVYIIDNSRWEDSQMLQIPYIVQYSMCSSIQVHKQISTIQLLILKPLKAQPINPSIKNLFLPSLPFLAARIDIAVPGTPHNKPHTQGSVGIK